MICILGVVCVKFIRHQPYKITLNHAFASVIEACSVREEGTWIGPDIKAGYALHQQGEAHSVEVWEGDELMRWIRGQYRCGFFLW